MSTAASQSQFGFVQKESSYATIPHSSGTATLANADAFRFSKLELTGGYPLLDRPDKTGGYGQTIGIGGRKTASWSAAMTLAPSGAAGTKPDIDEFLEALFGAAGTVSAGVSVTYAFGTADPSLAIWNFRDPATMSQMVALGAVVDSMKLSLGDGYAGISFDGSARWVLDSDNFSGTDATGKGGLTAFPTRPASPSYNGAGVTTFLGTCTLNGQTYATLRSANISVGAARSLPADVLFNGAYSGTPVHGRREITVDFQLTDDDTAALIALKQAAMAKTGVTLSFAIGTTAGNICTVTLSRVVLNAPSFDDGSVNWGVSFSGKAHASVPTASDEMTLVFT
jgi:hypothetical protein